MKYWSVEENNEIKLNEGALASGENLIKLKVSKVSMSAFDVACFAERNNKDIAVPAHSAVAQIADNYEDMGFRLGSRVVISPYVKTVEYGTSVVRTMGVDTDGLMRDFVCVPSENVFPLPDGIDDEAAVFAEHIAMGNKVFSKLTCEEGDYVIIVGAGALGLVLCQLANYYQMVPVLIDLDSDKLELAKSWDVCYTLNPTYDNLERKVEEITGGRMCEAAVFTVEGNGLNAALHLVKDGGEVIIAGYASTVKHSIDTDIILKKHLYIKGVCNGAGEMPSAINLLANNIVRTGGIITAKANFNDVPKMLEECIKYPYKYNTILFDFEK